MPRGFHPEARATSGSVAAGDMVVTAGNAQLADGAKVEVVASAAAAGE